MEPGTNHASSSCNPVDSRNAYERSESVTQTTSHWPQEMYYHLILEMEPSLLMTQPALTGSLELEPSNVAVDENLANHGPPHNVRYHKALGLRTRCGNAGKGSMIAYVPLSEAATTTSKKTRTPNINTDLTNPPSVFMTLTKSFPLKVASPRNLPINHS